MTKSFLSPHATDKYRPDIDGLGALPYFQWCSITPSRKDPRGFVGVDISSSFPAFSSRQYFSPK
jgi:hypothetical protein